MTTVSIVTVPVWRGGSFTMDASRRQVRGQVNGNVLVPTAAERTPMTNDPATRAVVEAIFNAFPDEPPNRTDIDPRALNTNSPQAIDSDRASGIFDQALGDRDRLTLRYGVTLQDVEAFQLVGGQNPDTTTKNHRARITWNRAWTPTTTTDLSAGLRPHRLAAGARRDVPRPAVPFLAPAPVHRPDVGRPH